MNINNVMKLFFGLIFVMIVGVFCVGILPQLIGCNGTTSSSTQANEESTDSGFDPINDLINAALDATGVKSQINDGLHESAHQIASVTGMSTAQADAAIDALDVEDWEVATLPSSASKTNTISTTINGTDATLTTYDNPRYVGVSAYGQSLTFKVPASATSETKLLQYL